MKRVKTVEREHAVMRFAADHLLNAAQRDSNALEGDLRIRDVHESAGKLEGTYIIRLFAEFETILRTLWVASRGRQPPSRTRDLLDGVGARCRIPHDLIHNAHTVREYRNVLVHERGGYRTDAYCSSSEASVLFPEFSSKRMVAVIYQIQWQVFCLPLAISDE